METIDITQIITPYKDKEIHAILAQLARDKTFWNMYKSFFPNASQTELNKIVSSIYTIHDFQNSLMIPMVDKILKKTVKTLSFSGIENIQKDTPYLFISNHRDIVFDPAFFNYILLQNNFDSTEIALGNNLLIAPWIKEAVRINKGFIVMRDLSPRQILLFSKNLSTYIRSVINQKRTSVWLAQKDGRAKDGNDMTHTGLLKMLAMSNNNFSKGFSGLNIVPLSISYEYNPSDTFTLNELIQKQKYGKYKKTKNQDMDDMERGFIGYKGNAHISIGTPINNEISQISEDLNKNEKINLLAKLIDHHIHKNYKPFSTNYIAYDILTNSDKFKDKYTLEEKDFFLEDIKKKKSHFPKDENLARELLLKMNANPIINKLRE